MLKPLQPIRKRKTFAEIKFGAARADRGSNIAAKGLQRSINSSTDKTYQASTNHPSQERIITNSNSSRIPTTVKPIPKGILKPTVPLRPIPVLLPLQTPEQVLKITSPNKIAPKTNSKPTPRKSKSKGTKSKKQIQPESAPKEPETDLPGEWVGLDWVPYTNPELPCQQEASAEVDNGAETSTNGTLTKTANTTLIPLSNRAPGWSQVFWIQGR